MASVCGFMNRASQVVRTYSGERGRRIVTLVFVSESLENLPPGWRARETYKIMSDDEFIEIFELAAPGMEFELYSENNFKRKK